MSRYTFVISNESGYRREVNPTGEVIIKGKREKNEFFYNKSIGDLKFSKDDYRSLIQFENSFEEFTIEIICNSRVIFEGTFTFLNADVCKDDCTLKIEVEEDSPFNCLRRNDSEVNILAAPLEVIETEIPLVVSSLDYYLTICLGANNGSGNCAPPVDTSSWGFFGDSQGDFQSGCEPFHIEVWAREIVTEFCLAGNTNEPAGSVVIQNNCAVDGTYSYAVPYSGVTYNNLDFQGGSEGFLALPKSPSDPNCQTPTGGYEFFGSADITVQCQDAQDPSGNTTIPETFSRCLYFNREIISNVLGSSGDFISNSRRLDDVIEYLVQNTNCDINCFESDFLNDPINYVTGDDNKLNNLLFHEKSDITRANASQDATISNISLFDLYKNLKETLNLVHRVNSNGCYEIEHVSRVYSNVVSLDSLGTVLINPCCYSVDKERIPKYEEWEWREANNIDFIGRNIEYRNSNGNFITDTNPEEHDVSDLTTDIDFIYNAYDRPQNPVNDLKGFVISHNEFDGTNYTAGTDIGALTGSEKLNGHLSQATLHDNYWRDDRYYVQGIMNNQDTTFNTTKPLKKNDDIVIKACCPEFDQFDLEYKILDLGDCGLGIVESFEYNLQTQNLNIIVNII